MKNIRVKYKYTSIVPYKDLEDGTPDFHHTPAVTVTNENGSLEGLLECLSSNSKIGSIVDFEYQVIDDNQNS